MLYSKWYIGYYILFVFFQEKKTITTYFKCQTKEASHLCIYSLGSKLAISTGDHGFPIGSTYDNDTEQFWFIGGLTMSLEESYLLNLFIVLHNYSKFSLFLPKFRNYLSNSIAINEAEECAMITGPTKEFKFIKSMKDVPIYVTTFFFTKNDMLKIGLHPLLVPCSIQMHTCINIHPFTAKKLQLKFIIECNAKLYEKRATGDFIIKSATGKEHHLHVFVAAARSSLFMNMIKQKQKIFILNDSDENIEMLIYFLYNGNIKNIASAKPAKMFEFGEMFALTGLIKLGEAISCINLSVETAVESAKHAKRFNLDKLSQMSLHFIKHHPKLLMSSGIQRLNDIDLVRVMLQYVGNPCLCDEITKKSVGTQNPEVAP